MRPIFLLPLLLGLAACATPREMCISNASKDLKVVDQLVRTTQGNLARGYAIETQQVLVNTEQVCGQDPVTKKDIMCTVAVSDEQQVPVAIDLVAEEAKLNSLLARRAELIAQRDKVIQQCIAMYPEG